MLQVRYAACVCARSFLQAAEGFEAEYYPLILPHLCFNRYDVAEGVRSYSLETWKLILKSHGPQQVARHINEVPEALNPKYSIHLLSGSIIDFQVPSAC